MEILEYHIVFISSITSILDDIIHMWTKVAIMSDERRQRYRERVGISPTQVYFNPKNESDVEAYEALEELKKIYGGDKQEKSKAIKEILKKVYQEIKKRH